MPTLLGLSVVRNEDDIVGQALHHAARNHDLLLVVDACSTDGTRAEIEAVSAEHPHVVLLATLPEPTWAEPVRRAVWCAFRAHVPPETWWSFVDADEFTDEDLRACVLEAQAEGADHIEGNSAIFYYREGDARAWREGRETFADRAKPIDERRRHYRMDVYSLRLFREDPRLRWNGDARNPTGLLRPLGRRVAYRHYQYRDVPQIEARLRTRAGLAVPESFSRMHYHWFHDVAQTVVPDDMPGLVEWRPGEPLVEDPALAPLWVPAIHFRVWRRLRRRWRAATTPQEEPSLRLPAFDPVEVLARRRRAPTANERGSAMRDAH